MKMEKVCDVALKVYGLSYVAVCTALNVALTVKAAAWTKKIISENFVKVKAADEKTRKED